MDTMVSHQLVHERCPPPKTVRDTGLEFSNLLRLLVKTMYLRGLETNSELVDALKLPLSVIGELLDAARERVLIEILGAAGVRVHSEFRHGLTTKGREWAVDALEQSLYVGPAPVSLADFHRQIERQRLTDEQVAREAVIEGLDELVVSDAMVRQLGPAWNAGRSVLLYGSPGNGKTTIAKVLGGVFKDIVHVPYAVDVDGQIIKVFDPALHHAVEVPDGTVKRESGTKDDSELRSEGIDRRWVASRRPTAIAGGELTLSMLDLSFNPHARFYEAPLHMKAIGGTFVIDDLGRQLLRPEDLLNRWIGPMEHRVDHLTLNTGRTFEIPFDVLLVFSTNLLPEEIMDPAFLRRIPYKIGVRAPTEAEFLETLQQECLLAGLDYEAELAGYIIKRITEGFRMPLAFYQPKFLVNQVLQACTFEGRDPGLTMELLDEAMMNLIPRSDLIGMTATPKMGRDTSGGYDPAT